jgi:hypothetical protein
MRHLLALSLALVPLVGWMGCSGSEPEDDEAPRLYPTLETLYAGDQGLYRGCGPNNGVCHNSREYPNLSTLGSLVENINLPCNERRDDPRTIHDLCERTGDRLRADGTPGVEIAHVAADPSQARTFRITLREPMELLPGARLSVVRSGPPELELLPLTDVGAALALDPADPSGHSVTVQLPPPETGEDADEDFLGPAFENAGLPADPSAIQVGDPNQNGTFGAGLGGALIRPGDPENSYLLKRLTDPTAGPLMPRANCCYWTKAALRSLWCWVAGLAEDGSNALDPIDYASCPPVPLDTMEYPEPGAECESSGMCPTRPALGWEEPTFANVYDRVISQSCAGASCHIGGNGGKLDMETKERAYEALVLAEPALVVPGDPEGSHLFVKVSPELCNGDCTLMPKGGRPLPADARGLIERWIVNGALND